MPRPEVFSERKSSSMMTIGKRKRCMGSSASAGCASEQAAQCRQARSAGVPPGRVRSLHWPVDARARRQTMDLECRHAVVGGRRRAGGRRAGHRHLLPADAGARARGRRAGRACRRRAAAAQIVAAALVGGGATAAWHFKRCAQPALGAGAVQPRRATSTSARPLQVDAWDGRRHGARAVPRRGLVGALRRPAARRRPAVHASSSVARQPAVA